MASERVRFGLTVRHRLTCPNFHGLFYGRAKILLQECAILRNALQTLFVRVTYDSQCCATQRKRAQFVSLELQISCSNQLSYAGAALYESRFSEFIKSSS